MKILITFLLLILPIPVFAQDQTVNLPVTAENIQGLKLLQQQQQADINTQQQDIANDQNGTAVAQAAIAQDQARKHKSTGKRGLNAKRTGLTGLVFIVKKGLVVNGT
jgi:hypothetical protein